MKQNRNEMVGGTMLVVGTLMVFNGIGSLDVGLAILPHALCSFAGVALVTLGALIGDFFD